MKLPRATLPIALASATSMGAQVLFSLLMLRQFAPQAVGEFSVVSQIAFFWMTLALAQSPLKLLADRHLDPAQALRAALRSSLLRLAWLLPVVVLAVQFSGLAQFAQVLAWAAGLALLQLGWYLAQAQTLKNRSAHSAAAARALPPVTALIVAAVVCTLWPQAGAAGLLMSAALGYAVGALWLWPARQRLQAVASRPSDAAQTQADNRSTALRLLHTGADALTGVAMLLVWQRSHGAAQAGYLAVLLRLLGFTPSLIHAAWAQVLLAQGSRRQASPLWIGLGGALATAALGVACAVAVQMQWLAASWSGMLPYLLPMVLWQGAACVLAASSHLPFQQGRARRFSHAAIAFDAMQLLALGTPLLLGHLLSPVVHVWWLAGLSTAGLLALYVWLARSKA
jgi:hypothetical protein